MNKIFKVIWNHTTQSWVAVSELTKAHGKTKSVTTAVAVTSLAFLGGISEATAALVDNSPTTANSKHIALSTSATGTSNAAKVTDNNNIRPLIAIGDKAQALGSQSAGGSSVGGGGIAIGAESYIFAAEHGRAPIAIGYRASAAFTRPFMKSEYDDGTYVNNHALQSGGVAIGAYARAGSGLMDSLNYETPFSLGIPTSGQVNSGWKAYYYAGMYKKNPATKLPYTEAEVKALVAAGTKLSTLVETSGQDQTAIGSGARALGDQSTAIGAQSIAGLAAIAIGANDVANANESLDPWLKRNVKLTALYKEFTGLGLPGIQDYTPTRATTYGTSIGPKSYADSPMATALGGASRVNKRATFGTAIGAGAQVGNNNINTYAGIAIGAGAYSEHDFSTAIGSAAKATALKTYAGGYKAQASDENAVAIGVESEATTTDAIAIGNGALSKATSTSLTAEQETAKNQIEALATTIEASSKNHGAMRTDVVNLRDNTVNLPSDVKDLLTKLHKDLQGGGSLATGNNSGAAAARKAVAERLNYIAKTIGDTRTIAIGSGSEANRAKAIAIGTGALASGESSISLGSGNIVSGNYSGAFGDPSIVEGTASYAFGNDNVVGRLTTGAFVLGNNNQMGAKPGHITNTNNVDINAALTNVVDVSGSVAVGSNNSVTTKDTFILGSGINTKADGITPIGNTVKNSVYLGKDSTAAAGTAAGTKNLDENGSTDVGSTTAGDTGTVNEATVAGVSYQGFQGNTADGVVTVGSAGKERRIQNVAAGEISRTSTDAINGSQLYLTHKAIQDVNNNIPVEYKNKNDNRPVVLLDDENGVPTYYYEDEIANLTYNPVDGTFTNPDDTKATPTPVKESDVEIAVKSDPKNITNVAGTLTPTYNLGNPEVTNGKADKDSPIANKANITTQVINPFTGTDTPVTPEDIAKVYNNAATVGDVLNSGWNLQENGKAKDFVKPYDTVNFIDSSTVNANVTVNDQGTVSNVSFSVNQGESIVNADGTIKNAVTQADKDAAEQKVKDAKAEADKLTKALEQPKEALKAAKDELANAKKALVDPTQELDNAKNKLIAAQKAFANAETEAEKQAATEKMNEAKAEITAAEAKVAAADAKVKEAEKAVAEKQTALNTAQKAADKADVALKQAQVDKDKLVNKVATVEDMVKSINGSGFNIFQDDTSDANHKALVNPGDKVVYKAAGEARVNVSKEKDGTTNITYSVDVPVIYTDEAGNKLIKGEDGKFYTPDALKGKELIDGKYYPEGSVKVGDKIYPAGSVVSGDKAYPAGTELKDDGTPKDPNVAALTEDNVVTPVEPQPGNVIASMNSFATDPKTGKETTATVPMGLSNVAAGANTYAADKGSDDKTPLVKVGDNYYKPTDFEKGKLKANATPTDYNAATSLNNPAAEAREGLADLDHSNPTNALTVADAKNLGWIVSSDKKTSQLDSPYADDVRNANEVRFVGKGLATVSGETITEGEGESEEKVRVITVDVNAQTVAEKAQLPVVYTDKDGNKLVKGKDGEFYKPEEIDGKEYIVDKKGVGKYYPKDSVLANDGKVYPAEKVGPDGNVITNNGTDAPKAVDPVEPAKKGDVIASMNNGNNESKDAPMNLANLRGNLPQTVNVGDTPEKVGADGKTTGELNKDPATKPAPARTERQDAPTAEEVAKIYNNAATVGDVLNSGWNLGINGDKKDFVKAYDTVNFVNGNGTLASVETNEKGDVSNVTFDIDKGEITTDENTGVLKGADIEALKKEAKDAADAIEPAKKAVETRKEELEAAKTALETSPESPEMKKKLADAEQALKDAEAELANKESLKVKADKNVAAVPNKVATVENVVSAVNKSGFTIYQDEATDSNKKALVNPGDKVVYAAEGLAKVEVTDEQDGVTKITYKVDAQAVAETAQLPVVYTDKDGNKLIKGDDGKFYPADSVKIDGKYYPKGSAKDGDVVKKDGQPATELQPKATGDVIASMNNAAGSTTNPMALTNIASNLSPVDTKVVFTETGVPVANPFDGKSAPALSKALENPDSPLRNNAATIGDVLNAGWNLQGNGEAKDFVRHTDTVNFVNGVGTTVSVTTDKDQKVSEVRVNSLIGLTDENGTPVIKGADNKFYKVDANGQPDKTQPVEAGDLVANVINPAAAAPNEKGDPLQLGNIAAGAKTFDNEVGGNLSSDPVTLANDGKWYPADQVEATGKPKADATAIPAPKGDNIKAGLIDFDNSKPNNALTVEDARNLGWIVSTSENQYADQVRNANKVNFKGKDGISVTGETNADGVREITIALKKGEVVKSNEFSVTKEGADKPINVIKVGDQYFNKDDIDPTTGKPIEGKKPVTVDETKDKIENKGENFVTGNAVADAIQKSGFTVGKATDTATVDFNNKDEKVNPDDNLRFADGKGTSVSLGTVKELDKAGNIQTTTVVKVDVDTAKISDNPNGSVKGSFATPEAKASAQKEVEKAAKDLTDAQTKYEKAVKDLTAATTPEAKLAKAQELVAATTALNKADKALADASKPFNKVATVENVVDAINNSGFTLKASAVENKGKLEAGTADKTKGELINPGKTVEMIAGKNMSVKHDKNGQITYATKDDVNFDSVQFGDNGPKIQRDGDNIKVSNSTGGPTKITNVAPGTADTDAVNVKQLKEAVGNINNNFGDINNRVNKLDKRMRGIGANVAAAASLPQVYIPGKSMISAAAGGYNGASAVAVGYSRASDNGKLILKLTGTANSTGQYSGGVGVGYQW